MERSYRPCSGGIQSIVSHSEHSEMRGRRDLSTKSASAQITTHLNTFLKSYNFYHDILKTRSPLSLSPRSNCPCLRHRRDARVCQRSSRTGPSLSRFPSTRCELCTEKKVVNFNWLFDGWRCLYKVAYLKLQVP